MPRFTPRQMVFAVAAAAIAIALWLALRTKPVSIDVGAITLGPMRVAVEEEGKTRVKQVYTVAAPVAGKLLRIALDAGDEVVRDQTVIAVVEPAAPAFLDQRARQEADALIAAAGASVDLAKAELRQVEVELDFAVSELKRSQELARSNTIPERTLEKARIDLDVRKAAVQRARASVELRQRELESARARLVGPHNIAEHPDAGGACCINVRSPVSGRMLKRILSSETIVTPGTALAEVGDVSDIEIVVELLSGDAVQVAEGAAATIDGWGGQRALTARVRRIEPAGFTKVSALGIEEQRVRTILDFDAPLEVRRRLGHDYRVFVRITTWSAESVLRVPLSALFRSGDRWAVFRAEGGRARLTLLEVGHRNTENAEILSGLKAGDLVVLHPSDRVVDGVRIAVRNGATARGTSAK